ncbi:hypothetical protein, partial [Paraburkholderia sp. XV]|uniref:hypothetical protein n=1 Tax=Paraburkholderia sp. XV TaxID=2831520 RepID=UPI001CD3464F
FFAAAKKSRCRPAQGRRVEHANNSRMPAKRQIGGCQRKVKSADASENANTQRTHKQTKNQRPRREGANADPSTKGRKPTAKASRMRIKKPRPIADQKTPANQKHFRYTCRPT